MKKKAILGLILAMMLSMSGCKKTEQLIKLEDDERAQIIQFSAHIISEFNRSQPEGYRALSKTQMDAVDEADNKTEQKEDSTQEEKQDESGASDGTQTTDNTPAAVKGTINDLVGVSGIEASVTGLKVRKDYVEENVFAMNASEGNKYVVVKIKLTNTTNKKVSVDILDKNPSISLQLNNEEETSKALLTLLTNDFLTTKQKIAAGKSIDTVLLFEVEKSKADSIKTASLITKDGDVEKTILIN